MDFRDYAATEAAASVRRVRGRSAQSSREQLEAVRAALDAASKALASDALTPLDEKEAGDLVARLTKASATATEQAVKHVSDEAQKAAEALRAERQAALKQVSDEAQKAAEALRAELQAVVKQKMALAASLKEAQAQAEGLRGELKTATDRGEIASRQLGEARKTNEKLETTRDELVAERDEHARARSSAEGELRKTRQALDAARAELGGVAKKLEKAAAEKTALEEAIGVAHSQSEAAEAKLLAVTDLFKQSAARVKALERAQQDHERVVRELEARVNATPPASAAQAPLALLDDLLAGFQALGGATTIPDVFTTLVEQLAAQFPRVALFRVKKNHLQGEHQIGFDLKTDIAKVMMPLGMDSLLARAASSGAIECLTAEDLKDSSRAPFSGNPGCALAVPIVVAGEALAIVYADDAGAARQKGKPGTDAGGVRFAEAMQQHAVAVLMRMTNELKVRAELQAYARSLLRELEQMYAADAQAEKTEEELRTRLAGNLEYARSIYESRVALEGGDAAALLDDELAALLDGEHGAPFVRDLAVVAGRSDLAGRARNTAEAS